MHWSSNKKGVTTPGPPLIRHCLAWKRIVYFDDDFAAFKTTKKHMYLTLHGLHSIEASNPTKICTLFDFCLLFSKRQCQWAIHSLLQVWSNVFGSTSSRSCDYLDENPVIFWCEIININAITFSISVANMSDAELFL